MRSLSLVFGISLVVFASATLASADRYTDNFQKDLAGLVIRDQSGNKIDVEIWISRQGDKYQININPDNDWDTAVAQVELAPADITREKLAEKIAEWANKQSGDTQKHFQAVADTVKNGQGGADSAVKWIKKEIDARELGVTAGQANMRLTAERRKLEQEKREAEAEATALAPKVDLAKEKAEKSEKYAAENADDPEALSDAKDFREEFDDLNRQLQRAKTKADRLQRQFDKTNKADLAAVKNYNEGRENRAQDLAKAKEEHNRARSEALSDIDASGISGCKAEETGIVDIAGFMGMKKADDSDGTVAMGEIPLAQVCKDVKKNDRFCMVPLSCNYKGSSVAGDFGFEIEGQAVCQTHDTDCTRINLDACAKSRVEIFSSNYDQKAVDGFFAGDNRLKRAEATEAK